MRFRLLELFAVVFVCAFACAALVRPSPLLASIFFSFTLCVLLVAILCAVARRGETRLFWIGFAIGGCVYLWLAREPIDEPFGADPPLVTTRLLNWSFDRIHPGISRSQSGGGMMSVASDFDPSDRAQEPTPSAKPAELIAWQRTNSPYASAPVYDKEATPAYMRAGHSFIALMIAWIAGHLTQFIRRRTT